MVDISLVGLGSFGPVGSVGSELDHLLGAAAGHGADELAGEVHLCESGSCFPLWLRLLGDGFRTRLRVLGDTGPGRCMTVAG